MSFTHVVPFPPTRESTDRLFYLALGLTLALKLVLAASVPLTGDEAYFVTWGRHADYGYYDHGAMTGWWVGLMLLAGKSVLLLRLPAVVTPLLGALVLRGALRSVDPVRANLAATLFLLSPVNILNVLLTTETPLLFFSLLAVAIAIRATRRERLVDWALAGVFLGCAMLAKYLAVLLGVALIAYLLVSSGRRRFRNVFALLVGTVPGIAVNLAWNINHGWTNIVFNLITRHTAAQFSPLAPLVLALSAAMVFAGPVVLYFLLRQRGEGRRTWHETWNALHDSGTLVALFAVAVPSIVLLVISAGRSVGLHWLLSFYPFFFLVLAAKFDATGLMRQVRPSLVYGGGCFAFALVLLALPVEWVRWHRSYNSIVLGKYPEEVLAQLASYGPEYTLMTPSYTQSAQLSYHSGRHVPVIGPGSHHGRQDDFLTDFRAFDGRDIMVLSSRARDAAATHAFFESVEAREVQVHGARIALVLGRRFKYAAYRDAVLRPIAEHYYRVPRWLAPFSRPAPFIARYRMEPAILP